MAFTGSQEDRITIRERFGAYSDAVMRSDLDAYLACWSDSCIRVSGNSTHRGKNALREHWTEIWATMTRIAFFTEIGAIEVRGDHAAARCYCHEIVALKSGATLDVVGVYTDQLVRETGGWVFSRREYQLFLKADSGPEGNSGPDTTK